MPGLPPIQLIEAPDRIFSPASIRMAGYHEKGLLGFTVVFIGGHVWNVTDLDEAAGHWKALQSGVGFMEHERWQYNVTDVCQVIRDGDNEVSVFFKSGGSVIVRKDAAGFYQKWRQYKADVDRTIAQMMSPIAQVGNQQVSQELIRKLQRGN